MKKLLLSCALLLGMGGVSSAAEYEIDQKFTSVADLDGKLFMIVNETDGKAIYNVDNQNLKYDTYANAVTGTAYMWKINAVAGQEYYTVQVMKANGEAVGLWGNNAIYLNSGKEGGFNGCFVLGNGSIQGTDVENGGVWYIEYSEGNGFALKNVARNGYFAGVNPAPTGTDPIYWTFCTIKEKVVEDTEDPGVKACPEGWTDMITNGTLADDETGSFIVEVGNGKEEATITEGAGRMAGRGIKVTSKDNASNVWDTQFFLVANEAMAAGTKLHVEFDYKASKAAKVTTQAHSAPGAYISNNGIGDVNFGLSWEHFETEIIVKDDNTKVIAFNLNENKTEAIDFYFDNLVMWSKANAITKGTYDATDALELSFADFKSLGGEWNAETKSFTGNCGFQWDGEGIDADRYQYLVITVAQNLCVGGYQAHIKDKNGKEVIGDQYGADYMNMWFGQWNHHNCMSIDMEKLRTGHEFDIHHITEFMIEGGSGVTLANAYFTNQKPNNDKNWGNEDAGDFSISTGIAVDKFGTVCLPYQAAIAGAKVYEIVKGGNWGVSLAEHDGLLVAGKPYFYQTLASNDGGKAPAAVRFYKATAATVSAPVENNGLIGTFEATTAPTGSVVLNDNKLWTVNSDVTVAANKAYIDLTKVTEVAGARGTVTLGFDEATAIKTLKSMNAAGDIFNMNGQRLAQPTKGLNIIGGKKVLVK